MCRYDESFPIVDGSLAAAAVDEEYCLSYAMPNCSVHLSRVPNAQRLECEAAAAEVGVASPPPSSVLVLERPAGTFRGLEVGTEYFVFARQQEEQLRLDQQAMAARARDMEGFAERDKDAPEPLGKDDGRAFESCSCIYGSPCVDEYGCRDWGARFAVAGKNGWKGF
jgi:hypothetical protein